MVLFRVGAIEFLASIAVLALLLMVSTDIPVVSADHHRSRAVNEILSCHSNPCFHGLCIDHMNSSYSCFCEEGYTGYNCQTDWNECWSGPCQHSGTCVDAIGRYSCVCQPGFTGANCEVDIDECQSDPCQNGATCQDGHNGYRCRCLPGYEGTFCEVDVTVCHHSGDNGTVDHSDAQHRNTTCHNGGRCVDGPGLNYHCLCPSGWTGKNCETDIDECCSDNRCHNNGKCTNLPGSYECACRPGYTGKDCESRLMRCDDGHCGHRGLCWSQSNGHAVCYCAPDFHGPRCQYTYNECLLPGTKCLNGGRCIDQVDGFSCSCPSPWRGSRCQTFSNDTGAEESNPASTAAVPLFTSTTAAFATTITITSVDGHLATTTQEPEITTLSTSIDASGTDPANSEGPPDATTLISDTSVVATYLPTPDPTERELTTALLPTHPASTTTTEADGEIDTSDPTARDSNPFTTIEPVAVTTADWTTTDAPPITTAMTTTITPPVDRTSTRAPPAPITASTTTPFNASVTGSDVGAEATTLFATMPTLLYPNESISGGNLITDAPPFEVTTVDLLTYPPETAAELTTEDVTTAESVTVQPEQDLVDTTLAVTSPPTWITANMTTSSSSCPVQLCLNGGTCISTSDGWQCRCSWKHEGNRCEKERKIRYPQFHGTSYLSYAVPSQTAKDELLEVKLAFSTTAPIGLVTYIHSGDASTYLAVFIERSALKFRLSCGHQQMTLVETKYNVSDGNSHNIAIRLVKAEERNSSNAFCMGSVKLNNSYSMNGEQLLSDTDDFFNWPWRIHIGGRPNNVVTPIEIQFLPGIVGCAYSLEINEKRVDMIDQAIQGKSIDECPDRQFTCGNVHCLNGGSCTPDGRYCLCPIGWAGESCEIRQCPCNPCQGEGSVCVMGINEQMACQCTYGRMGPLCEIEVNVTRPQFEGTRQGHSSFLSLTAPSFLRDHFEMKFHFVTDDARQVALLLFMGRVGDHQASNGPPPRDFLSVSFIRGHVALTWDLGSGTRRIFTARPVAINVMGGHTVHIGRRGRVAWLQVNNQPTVTGRSPGLSSALNSTPQFFLGGHSSFNHTQLPSDLPLHTGFRGCIYGVVFRSRDTDFNQHFVPPIVSGRGVTQCAIPTCRLRMTTNGNSTSHTTTINRGLDDNC